MTTVPDAVPRERYGVFDHDADIGIVGRGATIEAAFVAAATAMFDLLCRVEGIAPLRRIEVGFCEGDVELAFVTWLNLLLASAHAQGMVLCRFALNRSGDDWTGAGWGERWHPLLTRGIDVKGATLTMLAVREADDAWEARCIVDV